MKVKKNYFFMNRIGIPRNQTEYWSAGVLGMWSNLATHHHVRRPSAVLSAVGPAKADGPAKEAASAKEDLSVQQPVPIQVNPSKSR
jgi:hypothetical protein